MYQDEAVTTASKSGSIPIELHHRLIRGTVHCMIAVSSAPPFNRYPTSDELREMAKSLVLEYPVINCKETGHVSAKFTFHFLCVTLVYLIVFPPRTFLFPY